MQMRHFKGQRYLGLHGEIKLAEVKKVIQDIESDFE
jgi:hypothetical protein